MSGVPPPASDEASAAAEPEGVSSHPAWTLVATILASSLAFVDGSVVNVALPSIGRDLGAGAADLQWTINAYLLPLSALLLIGGAAGDRFGRRRLLIGGIVLFAMASLACARAPDLAVLLPARAAQGIGAALLMPNSLATLGNAFSGAARGRAIGTWAAVGAIASAGGPPLGGWLVQTVGWRAVFYINLPLAAAAIAVAWWRVGESAEGRQPLDVPGATFATLGLGGLVWGLTSWSASRRFGLVDAATLAGGVAAIAAFLLVERRRGDRAMMPFGLFGSRAFVGLTLYTFFLYGALGGQLVLLPYTLQSGGYDALAAGLALLPSPIVIGIGSRLVGGLSGRIGPRLPLTVGPLITAVGFALMARIDPAASYWTGVFPGMLVIALGMAGAVAPLTTAVLTSVDERHIGTASGFNSAIARTGGLLATALAGLVIGRTGAALLHAFQVAALIGAILALMAAASAFSTLAGSSNGTPPRV